MGQDESMLLEELSDDESDLERAPNPQTSTSTTESRPSGKKPSRLSGKMPLLTPVTTTNRNPNQKPRPLTSLTHSWLFTENAILPTSANKRIQSFIHDHHDQHFTLGDVSLHPLIRNLVRGTELAAMEVNDEEWNIFELRVLERMRELARKGIRALEIAQRERGDDEEVLVVEEDSDIYDDDYDAYTRIGGGTMAPPSRKPASPDLAFEKLSSMGQPTSSKRKLDNGEGDYLPSSSTTPIKRVKRTLFRERSETVRQQTAVPEARMMGESPPRSVRSEVDKEEVELDNGGGDPVLRSPTPTSPNRPITPALTRRPEPSLSAQAPLLVTPTRPASPTNVIASNQASNNAHESFRTPESNVSRSGANRILTPTHLFASFQEITFHIPILDGSNRPDAYHSVSLPPAGLQELTFAELVTRSEFGGGAAVIFKYEFFHLHVMETVADEMEWEQMRDFMLVQFRLGRLRAPKRRAWDVLVEVGGDNED